MVLGRARRFRLRPWIRLTAALSAATLGGGAATTLEPVPAAADAASDAAALISTINADRAWLHLPPLATDPALDWYAAVHSQQMAAAGTIFHSASLLAVGQVVPGWTNLGENVGYGPSVDSVESGFDYSPHHLANMLGPYDAVGVGVAYSGGLVYVTEEFAMTPY